MPKIYQLSAYGRRLDWDTWKSLGGCGLPNWAGHAWKPKTTLGEIEDISPAAGRSLARFSVERMKVSCFAEERVWTSGEAP